MKKIIITLIVMFLLLGFGKGIFISLSYKISIAKIIDSYPAHKGGYIYKYSYKVENNDYYGQILGAYKERKIGDRLWIRYSSLFPKVNSQYFSLNPFDERIFLHKDSVILFEEYN